MNFYLQSFAIFFKIGLFTIGGGYAMVPLIQDEIVNKRKWINKDDFIDLMASANPFREYLLSISPSLSVTNSGNSVEHWP